MTGLSLYSRLLRYVRPYRWAFGLAVVGMVIVAAGDLMLAWLVIPIVRNFEAPDPAGVLWLPFTLVGVFLLRGVGAYISEFGMGWTGYRVVFDLRRDLIDKLRETYCRTIGVQYLEISDKAQRDWLAQRMEPIRNRPNFTPEQSRAILFQLVAAEEFERFLHTRFVGQKRFSLEGAEALVPLINTIADDGDPGVGRKGAAVADVAGEPAHASSSPSS
jgi:hypothetical protein